MTPDDVRFGSLGMRLKAAFGMVPTAVLWLIVVLWTIPTIGLLVSSFRPPEKIQDSGWWTVASNTASAATRSDAEADAEVEAEIERLVAVAAATEQARLDRESQRAEDEPVEVPLPECSDDATFDPGALLGATPNCAPAAAESVDGSDPAALLAGAAENVESTTTSAADRTFDVERPSVGIRESLGREFSLYNYDQVLFTESGGRDSMITHFWNSLAIVIPATLIPISIAAFAAYAFAWMDFRGKNWLFVGLVSLMALPNQMAFVPLLSLYSRGGSWTVPFTEFTLRLFPDLGIANTSAAVWLTHTAFGLPLAIFLLHNYMAGLPGDVIEAARIDGADHFTIFRKIVLPLSIPALAAFAIFQFLWTWNDFLIASIFLNAGNGEPMTVAVAQLQGMFGGARTLRFAAAFVTMIVPLGVFFSMQKHFVRGLLAGSVKG